jgi:hypothetical protein
VSSDIDETWACSRCGVKASFAPGVEPTEPIGWACTDGAWRCLGCRRLEVLETASPAQAADSGRLRRWALTEFELLREPSASDQVIAKRAKCRTFTVAPVRAALRASGQLGPDA